MRRSVILSLAGSLAAVAMLAGCGSSGGDSASPAASSTASSTTSATPAASANAASALPARAALVAINKAVGEATSVHYVGTAIDGKQSIGIDVTTETKGDADAKLTMDGDTVQIRLVGDNAYLRADKAFWSSQVGAAAAATIGDKWIKFPKTSDDVADFVSFTDVTTLLEIDDLKKLKKGADTTIDGVPVFTLIDASEDNGGVLSAVSSGAPLPVRLTGTVGASKGSRIDFSAWNAPVTVEAPPASEVLDMSQLG